MRKKIRDLTIYRLLLSLLFVLLTALPTAAAEQQSVYFERLEGTLEIQHGGFVPHESSYVLVFSAVDEGIPMPQVTEQTITTVSGEKFSFGGMTFTKPGIYSYELRQLPGTRSDIIYDESVYKVKIIIQWADSNHSKLVPEVKLQKDGHTGKLDELRIVNIYQPPAPNSNPGGGSGGGGGGGGSPGRPSGGGSVTPQGPGNVTPQGPGIFNEGGQPNVNKPALVPVRPKPAARPSGLTALRRAVQTGDTSQMLVFGLCFLAAAGILGFWFIHFLSDRRKEREQSKE